MCIQLINLISYEGGAIGSLILRAMLSTLGLRRAMAIYGSIDVILLAIAMLLIKERHIPSVHDGNRKIVWFDRTFLRDPVFWSLGSCLLLSILYVCHLRNLS